MLTCPNCGYKQSGSDRCDKCRSLFAYYLQAELQGESAPGPATGRSPSAISRTSPASKATPRIEARPPLWRTAYRIMNWATLAALLVTIVLILHKAAPPDVVFDAQAAASAESKLSQAESSVAANQPYELTLGRTELNSYLATNLQLVGSGQAQSNSAPPPNGSSEPNGVRSIDAQAAGAGNPSIAEVQSTVRDVKVDLEGDVIKVYLVFDFHGKDLSLELEGHLSSADGYLQFQPIAGWLGSLPLPQSSLDAAVQRLVSSPENREQLRLPAGVQSIAVENSQLVIHYR